MLFRHIFGNVGNFKQKLMLTCSSQESPLEPKKNKICFQIDTWYCNSTSFLIWEKVCQQYFNFFVLLRCTFDKIQTHVSS